MSDIVRNFFGTSVISKFSILIFSILISLQSPALSNDKWSGENWKYRSHTEWMDRARVFGLVLGYDVNCGGKIEFFGNKVALQYVEFLRRYKGGAKSVYENEFSAGFRYGKKKGGDNCSFYNSKTFWKGLYSRELSGYSMPDFDNDGPNKPKPYVERHAENIDKAVVLLNEKMVVETTISFDEWKHEWMEQYRYDNYAYFPLVFDSIHSDELSSTNILCLITNSIDESTEEYLYGKFGERALKSAAILYATGVWRDSDSGQVTGKDNGQILVELNKTWSAEDVEKVTVARAKFNYKRLVKDGLFEVQRGRVACSAGILTDITSAERIIGVYFNNPEVIERNKTNDWWMRAFNIIPKVELQDTAALFRGFSSHAEMKAKLGNKPK